MNRSGKIQLSMSTQAAAAVGVHTFGLWYYMKRNISVIWFLENILDMWQFKAFSFSNFRKSVHFSEPSVPLLWSWLLEIPACSSHRCVPAVLCLVNFGSFPQLTTFLSPLTFERIEKSHVHISFACSSSRIFGYMLYRCRFQQIKSFKQTNIW